MVRVISVKQLANLGQEVNNIRLIVDPLTEVTAEFGHYVLRHVILRLTLRNI